MAAIPISRYLGAMRIVAVAKLPDHAKGSDFSFWIDAQIKPPFDATPFVTEPIPARQKAYGLDDDLFSLHDGKDTALFVAEDGGTIAGYVALSRGWTGCAHVNDIAIACAYRRQGIATALLDQASAWARMEQLPALRLETQSTNLAACQLYRRYGFELGGYDGLLYRELGDAVVTDVALFWYLRLPSDADGHMPAETGQIAEN